MWNKKLDKMARVCDDLANENSQLKTSCEVMKTMNDNLVILYGDNDQYSRRMNILLHGLPAPLSPAQDTPLDQLVCDALSSNLGIMITPTDFNAIHRLLNDFLNTVMSLDLAPVIVKATHIVNNSATILDNFFTNFFSDQCLAGIMYYDISDHLSIFLHFSLSNPKPSRGM